MGEWDKVGGLVLQATSPVSVSREDQDSVQARGNKMWLSGLGEPKVSLKPCSVDFECWKTPRFTPGKGEPRVEGMSFLEASQPPGLIRRYWLRLCTWQSGHRGVFAMDVCEAYRVPSLAENTSPVTGFIPS